MHPLRRADVIALALGLALLLGLELTRVDLAFARVFYDPALRDFPARTHWFFTRVSHDGLRWVSALVFFALLAAVWRPFGVLRRLPRRERVYVVAAAALCLIAIPLAKRASFTHCPWDLALFGGSADYLRLVEWPAPGAARGHCLPAGHAVAAFAYVGGFIALRDRVPRAAWYWLAAVLAFGLWAGVAQQMRGAHFLSHTLWTAWLSYALSLALAATFHRRAARSPA